MDGIYQETRISLSVSYKPIHVELSNGFQIQNILHFQTSKIEKTPVLLLVVAVCADDVHHRLWQTSKHSVLMNTMSTVSILSFTRKMETYIHECLNYVQTQLKIPSVQYSYSLETSHSKILYESMSRTLRISSSHDGEQMIEIAWKWCSFPVNLAWYVLSDEKVWCFSRDDFGQKVMVLHHMIQAKKSIDQFANINWLTFLFHHAKLHLLNVWYHVVKHIMLFDLLNSWVRYKWKKGWLSPGSDLAKGRVSSNVMLDVAFHGEYFLDIENGKYWFVTSASFQILWTIPLRFHRRITQVFIIAHIAFRTTLFPWNFYKRLFPFSSIIQVQMDFRYCRLDTWFTRICDSIA